MNSADYPWRALATGKDSLVLTISFDNDTDLKLYKAFFLHRPDEPPLFLRQNEAIEFDGGKMIEILITPNVITTDADLQSFDLEERDCFLNGEKRLRFFNVYSTRNCQLECFANFSSEICGCVPFDVVRDEATPVCELLDYFCVFDLEYEIKFEKKSEQLGKCNCLQECNTLSYDYEFIESRFRIT